LRIKEVHRKDAKGAKLQTRPTSVGQGLLTIFLIPSFKIGTLKLIKIPIL
jgi:hypothetical protein